MQVGQDILRHFLIIFMNAGFFIKQCGGTVLHRMEQIGTGPVKNRHEIIGNYLDTEFRQIPQGGFIVFNILVPGGQANLDIIMDVHAFHHIHIEACAFNLSACFFNFLHGPDLTCLLVMQGPY